MTGKINNNGFTLIELLVAASLLVIVISAVISVFVGFLRLQEDTTATIEIHSRVRDIYLRIQEDARQGYIDYDELSTSNSYWFHNTSPALVSNTTNNSGFNPGLVTKILPLRKSDGNLVFYAFLTAALSPNGEAGVYSCTGNVDAVCGNPTDASFEDNWIEVTDNIQTTGATFYVTPATNPYTSTATDVEAPMITLQMRIEPDNTRTENVQMSITTRYYAQ